MLQSSSGTYFKRNRHTSIFASKVLNKYCPYNCRPALMLMNT